jgi:hypothetical protein
MNITIGVSKVFRVNTAPVMRTAPVNPNTLDTEKTDREFKMSGIQLNSGQLMDHILNALETSKLYQ